MPPPSGSLDPTVSGLAERPLWVESGLRVIAPKRAFLTFFSWAIRRRLLARALGSWAVEAADKSGTLPDVAAPGKLRPKGNPSGHRVAEHDDLYRRLVAGGKRVEIVDRHVHPPPRTRLARAADRRLD
jgi:hypothetical protein